jgi:hypothetical protein
LDSTPHGRVFAHSTSGDGMDCRSGINIYSFLGFLAGVYALWIGSCMVLDDVVFKP